MRILQPFAWYLIVLLPIALTAVRAQQVERVYPSYNHSSLRGIVQLDDGSLYTGGTNSALLTSADGGRSWSDVPLNGIEFHIHNLQSDGTSLYMLAHSPVYIGDRRYWPEGYVSQLFRYDPGSNTTRHLPFPLLEKPDTNLRGEISLVFFDLAATRNAIYLSYAGFSGARLLVSYDRGENWRDLALPDSTGKADLHLRTREGSDDIMIFRRRGATGGTLYLSTDLGASWQVHDCPAPRGLNYSHILAMLRDGGAALQDAQGDIWIMKSDASWTRRNAPSFSAISHLAGDAQGSLLAFTEKGGCYRSDDDAATWIMLLPEHLLVNYSSFSPRVVTPDDEAMIVVNDYGNILYSSDRGVSWEDARKRDIFINFAYMADSAFGIVHVTDFSAVDVADFWICRITEDGFRTLLPCPDLPLSRVFPVTRTLWYAVGWSGFYHDSLLCRSTDGGASWELVLADTGTMAYSPPIDVRDSNAFALATSKGLLYTSDRGESWANILPTAWTNSTRPKKVIIRGEGEAIWMIANADEAFSIVRSAADWSAWDTVLVISGELRERIESYEGIVDLQALGQGRAYALTVTKEEHALLHYTDDDGATWQMWERNPDAIENRRSRHGYLLTSGDILSYYSTQIGRDINSIHSRAISLSNDFLENTTMLLERGMNTQIIESFYITEADARTVYIVMGMAVYRIQLPKTSNIGTASTPPLPLSIATPHPHPLASRGGAATLFIQSERRTQVQLRAYDMTGRLVALLYEGDLAPEGRHVSWNTSALAPGLYMLRLSSADGVSSRKVVLR